MVNSMGGKPQGGGFGRVGGHIQDKVGRDMVKAGKTFAISSL
jgi:hypothetical protein